VNAASPFAPFQMRAFDVVGTLIDFEKAMLDCLRQSGAAPLKEPDFHYAAIAEIRGRD
jgi:hypothetical protein